LRRILSPAQLRQIDWATFHSTTNQKSSFPNGLFKIRWANNKVPSHHRQFRLKLPPLADCPSYCVCLQGTDSQLMRCPHPERRYIYASSPKPINATSKQHNADPWLRQILAFVLLVIYNPSIQFYHAALTQPYIDLVKAQTAIGPASLFYGFFHYSFGDSTG
jgi:hypothetical protein